MSIPKASPIPAKTLLDPKDHTLLLIDYEGQMAFATSSIEIGALRNNTALVASAARTFDVPTILTTCAEKSFAGPMFPELTRIFPEHPVIDRTTMNSWEDPNIIK